MSEISTLAVRHQPVLLKVDVTLARLQRPFRAVRRHHMITCNQIPFLHSVSRDYFLGVGQELTHSQATFQGLQIALDRKRAPAQAKLSECFAGYDVDGCFEAS